MRGHVGLSLLTGLVGFGGSVVAVIQAARQDVPWLYVVPSGFLGLLILYVLKRVADVERAVVLYGPELKTHGEEINALREWKHDIGNKIHAHGLSIAVLEEQEAARRRDDG